MAKQLFKKVIAVDVSPEKHAYAKEYLGKAHMGGGYEDSVTDEDGVGLRNGLQEFKNVNPEFI